MTKVYITAGGKTFEAAFNNDDAARYFIGKMPFTVDMQDYNSNEKMVKLPENIPAQSTDKPATIHSGDIMVWSSNILVIFYKTFSNSYGGYVKLGIIEDTSSLADALGTGNVTVTFSLEP